MGHVIMIYVLIAGVGGLAPAARFDARFLLRFETVGGWLDFYNLEIPDLVQFCLDWYRFGPLCTGLYSFGTTEKNPTSGRVLLLILAPILNF